MDTKINNHKSNLKTRKQVEREISHKFYTFYKRTLECTPQKVICYISAHYLILLAEEAVTPLELTISQKGQTEILLEIRQNINRVLKSQLQKIVEEITGVGIIDIICDLNFNSHRMMAMALLTYAPELRSKNSRIISSKEPKTA